MALILTMHEAYSRLPGSIETDTDYAFRTCCLLTQRLTDGLQSRPGSLFLPRKAMC